MSSLDYIRFYHLRAYDRINAPASYIKRMEEHSGVKFHEAQVALTRAWIGAGEGNQTEVSIALPSEGGTGLTEDGKKPEAKIEKVKIPPTLEEAKEIIQKWEKASQAIPEDDHVSDNVVQHMLADSTTLKSEKWAGSEEEERNAYVSELLYIHSKLMIVDDRVVIVRCVASFTEHLSLTIFFARWVRPTSMIVRRKETETRKSLLLWKTQT